MWRSTAVRRRQRGFCAAVHKPCGEDRPLGGVEPPKWGVGWSLTGGAELQKRKIHQMGRGPWLGREPLWVMVEEVR